MSIKHRFDFSGVMFKVSTWLGLAATAAAASLAAYGFMPDRVQALMPDWALITLGAIVLIAPLAVPFATAFKQKRFQPEDPDIDRAGA